MDEFELIKRFMVGASELGSDVRLGIGDDCALLVPPLDSELAMTMDTLVEGRHFFPNTDPEALGHKCLAVNLSDLAAMGAQPLWVCLALTLPQVDESWLEAFMRGFAALANRYDVTLIGGDTTRGPLSITIQATGKVEPGRALRRAGAAAGDGVYVSGVLGDAGLALDLRRGSAIRLRDPSGLDAALDRPEPRVALGRLLGGVASSAIDVSDGLLADLGHICTASSVGAQLEAECIPVSAAQAEHIETTGDLSYALSGGDDYELCFTVAPDQEAGLARLCTPADVQVTRIGEITAAHGVQVFAADGRAVTSIRNGYNHFNESND